MSVATALAIIFMILMYAAIYYDNNSLEMGSYAIISIAFLIVVPLSMHECLRYSDNKFVSFNIMVKKALDEYFSKVNVNLDKRGLEWYAVEGHYWIELRIFFVREPEKLKTLATMTNMGTKERFLEDRRGSKFSPPVEKARPLKRKKKRVSEPENEESLNLSPK